MATSPTLWAPARRVRRSRVNSEHAHLPRLPRLGAGEPDLQRMVATDAVNVFIFNPSQVAVAKKGLKGLWTSSPIFANDMAAVSWQ